MSCPRGKHIKYFIRRYGAHYTRLFWHYLMLGASPA